jgi:hypothetical protein
MAIPEYEHELDEIEWVILGPGICERRLTKGLTLVVLAAEVDLRAL